MGMTRFFKFPILLSFVALPFACISCSQETSSTVYSGDKNMFLNSSYKPETYDKIKTQLKDNPSYILTNLKDIISREMLRDTIYLFIWNEIFSHQMNADSNVVVNNLDFSFTNVDVTRSLNGSFTCDFFISIKYSITKNNIPVYYKSTWTSLSSVYTDGSRLDSKQELIGYADPEFTIEQELKNPIDYKNIGPSWSLWNTFHDYYITNNTPE